MTGRPRRLSSAAEAVLEVMLEKPTDAHYGLELMSRTSRPSGTMYPLLRTLEQRGLIGSEWENIDPSQAGRPRRMLYRLTGHGEPARGALRANRTSVRPFRAVGVS
jgi:PadR family transcriptional regulator